MAGDSGLHAAEDMARQARESVQRGNLGDAEGQLLRAVELAPKDPRYPAALATVFLRGGRHSLAAVYAQLAAMLAPNEDRYQRVLGAIWEAAGDTGLAREAYLHAARTNPSSERSWLALARVEREGGHYGAAEGYARRALELAPQKPEPLVELGTILEHTLHLAEALDLLSGALLLAPNDPTALYTLGCVQAELGRFREARATLGRAVSLIPANAVWLVSLARVHWALGERDSAKALLKRAKALPGTDGRDLDRVFAAPFEREASGTVAVTPTTDPAAAMPILEHAAASLPELEAAVKAGNADPYTYSQLSLALTRAGRTPEALDAAREAEHLRTVRRAATKGGIGPARIRP